MSLRHILAVLVFLSFAPVSVQADSPKAHLTKFKPFIGQWVFQGESREEDGSDEPAKGTSLTVVRDFRWALNQQAVTFDWSLRAEGQLAVKSKHLIVWDKVSKKITCFWQTSDGSQGTTDWTFQDDGTLVGKVHSIDIEGIKSTSTVYHSIKDSTNAYIWWATDKTRDGKKLPDTKKYRFVRSK